MELVFRIKGTHYYSADLAYQAGLLQPNAQLLLVNEPDNAYDCFAIQIWLANSKQQAHYLLGYVPRQSTLQFHFWQKQHCLHTLKLNTIEVEPTRLCLYANASIEHHWWHKPLFLLYQAIKKWRKPTTNNWHNN